VEEVPEILIVNEGQAGLFVFYAFDDVEAVCPLTKYPIWRVVSSVQLSTSVYHLRRNIVLCSDIVSLDLLEGVGLQWFLAIGICLMSLKGLCSSEIDEFDAVVLIKNEVFSLLRKLL
jgi:hypothetical protein